MKYKSEKGAVHPKTRHEGPERKKRNNSNPSLTSATDKCRWSTPHYGRFITVREIRYPLHSRLGGPQGWFGWMRKNLTPTGIRSSDCPSRRQSLYHPRYPDPHQSTIATDVKELRLAILLGAQSVKLCSSTRLITNITISTIIQNSPVHIEIRSYN